MTRAVGVSMAAHVALIGTFVLSVRTADFSLPARSYTVDLVGQPAGARGGKPGVRTVQPQAQAQTARARDGAKPSVKSGVQVKQAPSTEKTAARGTKKGAAGSKGAQEAPPTGGLGIGTGGGMRLEGDPFPYRAYLEDLQARIEQQWQKPLSAGPDPLMATVQFSIQRDGSVISARVESSSGRVPFDRAALDAVIHASPLAVLPAGYAGASLTVHLDFTE